MEFTNFMTIIKEEVEKRAGKNCEVKLNTVMKNNGIVLNGITVMKDDSNISPTIYLNNFYEAYEKKEISLTEIVEKVMDVYEKNKIDKTIDMKYFLDYEKVKNRIVYKLINTDKNKELLKDVPHINYHDLSIVFQFLLAEETLGSATILVHNAHLKIWNISEKDLFDIACINTPRLHKYEINNIKDVIYELMSMDGMMDCGLEQDTIIPMYVLSNKNRIHGAACMLYPDLIKDFSTAVNKNLFIIPSSIHEVLLLPVDDMADSDHIKDMVKEVNSTQLEVEEILSDSLYYYDRSVNEIVVA